MVGIVHSSVGLVRQFVVLQRGGRYCSCAFCAQQNALNLPEWLGQDMSSIIGMFGGDVLSSAVGDRQDFVEDRWHCSVAGGSPASFSSAAW